MPSMGANEKRKFLVAAKNCKRGMYECAVFDDHVNCSCPCYKYNNLCKHSICVAEIAGILKEHLQHLQKSPKRRTPSKSGLVEPPKDAHGKKGASHKNPYRPTQQVSQVAFPQRQQISPFDIILSHEEKWLYPDPKDPGRKLPSVHHTTKFYCITKSCIKTRFPPFWRFQQSSSPA